MKVEGRYSGRSTENGKIYKPEGINLSEKDSTISLWSIILLEVPWSFPPLLLCVTQRVFSSPIN